MKAVITIIILSCCFFSELSAAFAQSSKTKTRTQTKKIGNSDQSKVPRKRALLVGISKYARGGKDDWWNLSSARDVELLGKILRDKFEFDEVTILDEQKGETSKAAIIKAFRSNLINKTQKDDIVYFHFSGHGQQIPDNDGDEIDGYDESIVPSDYVSQKDGSRNLRDDEIGQMLDELKKRQPANVTVSLDSCYSGSATRGELPARGGDWQGEPVSDGLVRGEDLSGSGFLSGSAKPAEGYVFLSAASPNQAASQTYDADEKPMGLFTYALVKALAEANPKTTYRDLFERVNDLMIAKAGNMQTPQLEGELDKKLMDGATLPLQNYLTVKTDENGTAKLQAGKLQGMTRGSKFAIYPGGTKNFAAEAKLADAEIVELDSLFSTLKILSGKSLDKNTTLRAVETERSYSDFALKIAVEKLEVLEGGAEIQKELEKLPLVRAITRSKEGSYDLLIRAAQEEDRRSGTVEKEFRGVILQRPNGFTAAKISEEEDLIREIQIVLKDELRWQVVRSLEGANPEQQIELRLVKIDKEGTKIAASDEQGLINSNSGQIELEVGDLIMLEVRNTGESPVYVTILNLRSDGKVGPGFPQKLGNLPASDNRIKNDGEWKRIAKPYVFRITEPVGAESFKAIATLEPTDFTPLIDAKFLQRSSSEKSELEKNAEKNPLGKVFLALSEGKRSGSADAPPEWTTATVTFLVKQ